MVRVCSILKVPKALCWQVSLWVLSSDSPAAVSFIRKRRRTARRKKGKDEHFITLAFLLDQFHGTCSAGGTSKEQVVDPLTAVEVTTAVTRV